MIGSLYEILQVPVITDTHTGAMVAAAMTAMCPLPSAVSPFFAPQHSSM
jgi:hypothetical protein